MTAVEALRQADACPRCYERMARDNPGGTDIRKQFPTHLKAICWAYLCDACAEIVVAAIGAATTSEGGPQK